MVTEAAGGADGVTMTVRTRPVTVTTEAKGEGVHVEVGESLREPTIIIGVGVVVDEDGGI